MRLILVLLFLGVALIYASYEEGVLHALSKPEPQPMTVEGLITHGPGDNIYVELSEYLALTWGYATQYKYNKDHYLVVWTPLFPKGGAYHQRVAALLNEDGTFKEAPMMPEDIRVMMKSERIPSKESLEKFAREERVTGLIINEIDSLRSDEVDLLKKAYPNLDLDRVYVLEHEREPASKGLTLFLLVLGLIFMGSAIWRFKKDWIEDAKKPART